MSKIKTKSKAPEYLADLLENSTLVLIQSGLEQAKAIGIAEKIAKQMCSQWGGQLIYFPYGLNLERDKRYTEIYKHFNGDNHEELSRRFNVSIQFVYRVVKFMRAADIHKRQNSFDM